jgi:UDPglucose 6-dehydrogenase
VEKSTVPVNTHEQVKRTVSKYLRADIPFDVASNPEFLKEGTAIEDAYSPDRIVVGVESERAAKLMRDIYEPIIKKTNCPFLVMNPASAELTKHASNSFLAMKISFINAVARVCEMAGANVEQVAQGMGLDKRIGPQFLKAGVGYGGSCFPKDVDAFVQIADHLGYNFELLKEVQRVNKTQREHLMQKLQRELWVIQDKVIAVLGLAFKPGTDDVRESPSLYFVPQLIEGGRQTAPVGPRGRGTLRPVPPRRNATSRTPSNAPATPTWCWSSPTGRRSRSSTSTSSRSHEVPGHRGRPQRIRSQGRAVQRLHLPFDRPGISGSNRGRSRNHYRNRNYASRFRERYRPRYRFNSGSLDFPIRPN